MGERNFKTLLGAKWAQGKFVCVGLDPVLEKIPAQFHAGDRQPYHVSGTYSKFIDHIVRETRDFVCAYKPNTAFFERHGIDGWVALEHALDIIRRLAPDVPIILDAKRADIGNTNEGYVGMAFDTLKADAITINPYLGKEAVLPFLKRADKGIIILCRTSNKGAGEFQDLHTLTIDPRAKPAGFSAEEWLQTLCLDAMLLHERVAFNVAKDWNKDSNCVLVVGATYPAEAKKIRAIVGDVPFLIPGIGTQGGDVEATVMACHDSSEFGMIINSSSGIIFAPDPRKATLQLHESIQGCF